MTHLHQRELLNDKNYQLKHLVLIYLALNVDVDLSYSTINSKIPVFLKVCCSLLKHT